MHLYKGRVCLVFLWFIIGCSTQKVNDKIKTLASPKREFRAAWIATVANIDWPSSKSLSSDIQQSEFKSILDLHKKNGLNAVLVQIRTASDALYAKSFEPWSVSLTGQLGKAPSPFYDPLRFMIEEAHQRNLEFHAWFNLDRGTLKSINNYPDDHITKTKPAWFFEYGGQKYYDFGNPDVRAYIKKMVLNVLTNYDVDGIHFDDYFYPYTIQGESIQDSLSYKKYGLKFNNVEDWRRSNINTLIKEISEEIYAKKYWVKFGISPFGVWRNAAKDPNGSNTQAGQTSYDNLFADTKLWMKNGWIDYIIPQIYFSDEHPKVPFEALSTWWANNSFQRNLYLGHGIYKVDENSTEKGWENPDQISKQLTLVRSNSKFTGSAFYNTSALKKNKLGVSDTIAKYYATIALQPLMPWKKSPIKIGPVQKLTVTKVKDTNVLEWISDSSQQENIHSFVIYRFIKGHKVDLDNPSNIIAIVRNLNNNVFIDSQIQGKQQYLYGISVLDKIQNESNIRLSK